MRAGLRLGRLQSRLTVLYAGLFGLTLLLIFIAGLAAVTRNAERQVTEQLVASGEVFDSLLALRAAELQSGSGVLARDFGFREAVATGDAATEASALANLQARMALDLAFVVDLDGGVIGAEGSAPPRPQASMLKAIADADGDLSGLMTLGDDAYFAVSSPVRAPELLGWVVFARRVDAASLAELQDLSAIPLTPAVVVETGDRRVVAAPEGLRAGSAELAAWRDAAAKGPTVIGGAATLVRRLPTIGGPERAVLLLRYPLSAAMAPYRTALGVVLALGIAGLGLAIAGSWALARSVTRPILALNHAAGRLREGELVPVAEDGADEVVSLARSFNAMAAGIRHRETALAAARDVAESASRAKDVFLTNMSHELRTPLNGVLGLAGVLSTTPLDDRQRQMVTLMERSAGELRDVLSAVLDLTNLTSGQAVLLNEPFDLRATLDRVCSAAAQAAAGKGLLFNATLQMGDSTGVLGDEARVAGILEALLSNAVKFTDAGVVALTAGAAAGGGWRIEVRDTGVGFDPAETEALFIPFRQADGSSTRRFGGAGLGLSLARELAQAMGGTLVAQAAPGRGAAFTVALPLPPADLVLAPMDGADAPQHPALRVLVADDHPTNRKVVELILHAVGAEMVGVENGAQALAAFDAEPFDAVLMDIQMPVMDGLEAIRGIRAREAAAHTAPTPIVVLSANALPDHHAASLAAGADDHVNKPVSAPALIAALERAVARCDRLAA